jgi:Flp pilus assembly protein TadD
MLNNSSAKVCLIWAFVATGCLASGFISGCTVSQASAGSAFESAEPVPTAQTLYAMANLLSKQGRNVEYENLLKRITKEYPKFLPAYNDLAEFQMRQGRTAEAVETIDHGLLIYPKNPQFLNNLGMCRLIQMEYEKALAAFSDAAGLVPENEKYRANMAVSLALMDRYEEAQALFSQILEKDQADHNLNLLQKVARNDAQQESEPKNNSSVQEQ